MTTLEVLVAARALIDKPEHWCQDVNARNTEGRPVMAENDEAYQWCLRGSILKAGGMDADPAFLVLFRIINAENMSGVHEFGDTHTHAEVLGLLDTAIAELQA